MRATFKTALASPRLTSWLQRLQGPRTLILVYHDLRDEDDPASWLRVSAQAFAAHLAELTKLGRFIAPDRLFDPDDLQRPGLRFLITFDDGYRNNHRLALPLLRQFHAPALFFVSTWHLQTGEPFWFDRLVTPIQALRLERLDLSRFGLREYDFGHAAAEVRWEAIERMLRDIKALGNEDHPEVHRLIDHLDSEYGADCRDILQRFRPLTSGELHEMAASGIAYFGSHAHRHEILTKVSPARLRENLTTSRQLLERMLGAPVQTIAYPNGDWNDEVTTACRDAGYRLGFLARGGLVGEATDRLRIPRQLVGGFDSAALICYQLNRLLAGRHLPI